MLLLSKDTAFSILFPLIVTILVIIFKKTARVKTLIIGSIIEVVWIVVVYFANLYLHNNFTIN